MNRRVVQTFLGSVLIGASVASAGFFAWQARNDAPAKIEVAGAQALDAGALLAVMNQENGGSAGGTVAGQSAQLQSKAAVPAPASVNINTASQAQLETLPGIGPVIAGRIIEYRTKNGGIKNFSQLEQVKGIGPKTIEKLKPYVTF